MRTRFSYSNRFRSLALASLLSSLALTTVASCQAPAAPEVQTASLPRSLWVWDATILTNPPHAEELLAFCAQKHISVVYISLGDVFSSTKREPTDPRHVTAAQLRVFVRAAHSRGVQVEGLDGDPSFALTPKHEMTLKRLQKALAYNHASAPEERLDGWQWDTEPYLLPEYKAGPEGARDVLLQYLNSAAEMRDAVKGETGFRLGYAIPSFFDAANKTVAWRGVSKPAGFHLLDLLDSVGGYVAIMAYREKADGQNGTIQISQDEVDYARKNAPRARVWIGQETGAAKGDPETITFWEEGEGAMETELAKINAAFAGNPVLGGIAIHHWASYEDISRRLPVDANQPITIANPAVGDSVGRTATISGTAKTTEPGAKVVLSVRPAGDVWYKQGEATITDGRWEVPCRFGNEKTPAGRKFDIRVELVTADGSPLARIEQATVTK